MRVRIDAGRARGALKHLAAWDYDLRAPGAGGKAAVAVLVAWLPRVSFRPLKEDIIATLGSRWARPQAARPLIEEFLRIDPDTDPPGGLRWMIGDALERVADESVLDDVIAIATDDRHGSSRALVVTALGNMRKARERVVPLLTSFLADEGLALYALMGLGKLGAAEARPAVEPFLQHPDPDLRKEAKRALSKMTP